MQPAAPFLPTRRPPAAVGVLALHAALLLFALQTDAVQRVLPQVMPVTVSLLATPEADTAPALPTRSSRDAAPSLPTLAPPTVEVRSATPGPAAPVNAAMSEPGPAASADATPPAALTTAQSAAQSAAPMAAPTAATPAPAPTAPPAEPRLVAAGAISYRVPPAIAVPLASRRLREGGTVWLRVRVDRQGLPVQVAIHQSSGYPRLDEQALAAMQAARFVPQTENGAPIDWVVIAPLAYDID